MNLRERSGMSIDNFKEIDLSEINNEHLEIEKEKITFLIVASLVVAMASPLLMGYDEGIMSGAIDPLKGSIVLTSQEISLVMGILNIMAGFGALFAGFTADLIGRKRAIMVTSFLLLIGPLIMCTSNSFLQLLLGRIITGFGIGFSFCVPPLYAAELAPTQLRGSFIALTEVLINFGIFIGYTSSYFLSNLSDELAWRLMLGLAALIPSIIFLISPFLPETPRWLMSKGRTKDAVKTLKRIYKDDEAQVRSHQRMINETIEKNEKVVSEGRFSFWKEIFRPTAPTRRMLTAGLGIAMFQQLSGSEAVVYYSPQILKDAGFGGSGTAKEIQKTILLATMGVGFSKFLTAVISTWFIDNKGRRFVGIISSTGVTLSLALLTLSQAISVPILSFIALCSFMITFQIGLGPLVAVLGAEIYPIRIRASCLSLALFLNRIISGIISGLFPTMVEFMGAFWTYFFFTMVAAVGIIFCFVFIPETKGISLENIQGLFEDENGIMDASTRYEAVPMTNFAIGDNDEENELTE